MNKQLTIYISIGQFSENIIHLQLKQFGVPLVGQQEQQVQQLCYNAEGSICGLVSQSCCKTGYCAMGWLGQECEIRLFIPGCTTDVQDQY
ncbi:hypothetical protein pb186bvf_000582 [Paramecium bursaria]